MNPFFWVVVGIGIYGCLSLFVIALGKAAAVGDEQLEQEQQQ